MSAIDIIRERAELVRESGGSDFEDYDTRRNARLIAEALPLALDHNAALIELAAPDRVHFSLRSAMLANQDQFLERLEALVKEQANAGK